MPRQAQSNHAKSPLEKKEQTIIADAEAKSKSKSCYSVDKCDNGLKAFKKVHPRKK